MLKRIFYQLNNEYLLESNYAENAHGGIETHPLKTSPQPVRRALLEDKIIKNQILVKSMDWIQGLAPTNESLGMVRNCASDGVLRTFKITATGSSSADDPDGYINLGALGNEDFAFISDDVRSHHEKTTISGKLGESTLLAFNDMMKLGRFEPTEIILTSEHERAFQQDPVVYGYLPTGDSITPVELTLDVPTNKNEANTRVITGANLKGLIWNGTNRLEIFVPQGGKLITTIKGHWHRYQ